MTQTSGYIRTGFFADFKGFDTVLISVDNNGLSEVESLFGRLADGTDQVDLLNLSLLDPVHRINIVAKNHKTNAGLIKDDNGNFLWLLTNTLWDQFRQMAASLNKTDKGGHHYLDSESNYFNAKKDYIDIASLQVILSLYEYPLSFWQDSANARNGHF
jgi:hypothetical protein